MTEDAGCNTCKHWRGGMTCDAYPNGIPWPIMSGEIAHFEPLPDDNGIQFEWTDIDLPLVENDKEPQP